jgi:hypothetical protein
MTQKLRLLGEVQDGIYIEMRSLYKELPKAAIFFAVESL